MYLSFNSSVMTASQITDYLTRVVQPKLQTVDGVANAQILGGQTFAMRIWLDPDRMAALRHHAGRRARPRSRRTTSPAPPGQIKGDFVQTSINALTSLDSAKAFGQLVVATRGDSLIRLGNIAHIELGPAGGRFVLRVRRAEGRVHRHLRHAVRQPADRHRRHPRGHAGDPARAAGRAEGGDRLRLDGVHPGLDPRGGEDAGGSGGHRHRRDLPVPRQPALDRHPDRHDPAVADRRDDAAAGARLFDQPADAAGAGAGDRPRRRRRHRRGREHLPPHRGRHDALRGGAAGRARDRAAGHRHDHHAGRGLCADRLRLGPDRRAVPRVRLHARGRGRSCPASSRSRCRR